MSNELVTNPTAGSIARSSFNENAIERTADTAATAVAARSRAMVEARYVMAMRNPRNLDQVRSSLLRACERPGFADVAYYRKPVGKGVEGLSIRFAEEAARCLTNLDIQVTTIHDDPETRIIEVNVIDLEANLNSPVSIAMAKTVERRQLRDGQTALRMRTNSGGQVTYLIEATDDELLVKQAALTSKAMRTAILRLLPGDIVAEARARIVAIRHGDAAKDPEGARRRAVSPGDRSTRWPSRPTSRSAWPRRSRGATTSARASSRTSSSWSRPTGPARRATSSTRSTATRTRPRPRRRLPPGPECRR